MWTQTKIKNFLKISGMAGVPVAFVIFYYLVTLNAITILYHSGDMNCAGTISEPCYAEIVFRADQAITISAMNTNWIFSTDKTMKRVETFRDGKRMYFNKSNSFSKGKTYNITFLGYKNNPEDIIKWSFGTLDPVWYPASFNNSLREENLSFGGQQNITRYLNINRYEKVNVSYLNISADRHNVANDFSLGLVEYHDMNGLGNITDSLSKYNITINGPTPGQGGKLNNSFYFNGSKNPADKAEGSTLVTNSSFTMCLWMKSPDGFASATERQVLMEINATDNALARIYWHQPTGRMRFSVGNSSTGCLGYDDGVIAADTWYHFCGTFNETSLSVLWYKQGSLVAAGDCTGNEWIIAPTSFTSIILGTSKINPGWNYTGWIDEIGIWNRTLNSTEISSLYNGYTGITYSAYPSSPFLYVGGKNVWNYSGTFSHENNKTIDLSKVLNAAVNSSNCSCTGCILSGVNCSIPFIFYSNSTVYAVMNYKDIRIETEPNFSAGLSSGTSLNFYPNATIVNAVPAYGQTASKGVFNISNPFSSNFSVWIQINETRSYMTLKVNNISTWATSKVLNTTVQKIISCMPNNSQAYIWIWADYTQNSSQCFQSFPNASNSCGGTSSGNWVTNGNFECNINTTCNAFYAFDENWSSSDTYAYFNFARDAEASYDCFIEGNTWSPAAANCSRAVDENWSSAASTFSVAGNYSVYENYTLTGYNLTKTNVSWKFKIGVTIATNVLVGDGCTEINYWNWTASNWQVLGSALYSSAPYGTTCYNLTNPNCVSQVAGGVYVWNCTELLPNDALNLNDIRFKTIVRQKDTARDYYEGEILVLKDDPAIIYYNYTAPSWAQSATWEIRDGNNGYLNITIDSRCFAQSVKQLRGYINNTDDDVYWDCFNGSTWVRQAKSPDALSYPYIYESAVIWDMNKCFNKYATEAQCGNQNMSKQPNGTYSYSKDWTNVSFIFDGNYATGGKPNGTNNESNYYEKWQVPNYATSAQWMLHGDAALLNRRVENIPASCFRNPIYTRIQEVNTTGNAWFGYFYCKNSTGWQYILSGIRNTGINETGMIWNMSVRANTTYYPKVTISAREC
jgi:hypothetical protein